MRLVLRLIIVTSVLLIAGQTYAQAVDSTQKDLVDVVLGKKAQQISKNYRAGKKVHYSLFPAAVNVPGGGRAVITSVNAAFYLGDPATTNLSNVYLIPYTNLGDRYGLYVRPNIWVRNNRINFVGDYRIAHFPQYTWGLGPNSPQWDESLIDADYLRIHQSVLIRVYKYWYLGPGYALDYHYNISESDYLGEGHLERYGEGSLTGTVSSGFTFNLVYDSRINAINPPGGAYFLASWRANYQGLGSTYSNHYLFTDLRKYFNMSRQIPHVLALRLFYWTRLSGETPYLDLPATNWAPASGISNRGFETGRYRSHAMLYSEAEQRFQISRNGLFGMVAFVNVSSASEFDTTNFRYWNVGGGAGFRLKLNKFSQANLAVDFGFSQNFWSVWLNVGEMF